MRSVERPRRVVTTRRSSVTEPARMSSRVEFVSAVDDRDRHGERGHDAPDASLAQLAGDPTTDGVVEPGEEGCVVSVEALHALARAADATRWSRTLMTGGDGRVALLGVRGVRGRELLAVDGALCCPHAPPASSRLTASDSAFPTSQKRVGIGVPSSRRGAFRITTGRPWESRATTSNAQRGALPSSSVTTATSSTATSTP